MPLSAHGICSTPLAASSNCSSVSGASEAPKSTVREVICVDPATAADRAVGDRDLRLAEKSDCHFDISGATRVLPAPTSGELAPPPLELAVSLLTSCRRRRLATASASAAATLRSLLVTRISLSR